MTWISSLPVPFFCGFPDQGGSRRIKEHRVHSMACLLTSGASQYVLSHGGAVSFESLFFRLCVSNVDVFNPPDARRAFWDGFGLLRRCRAQVSSLNGKRRGLPHRTFPFGG